MDNEEPEMSENNEVPVMTITCLDGTVLQVPDDDGLAVYLPGVSTDQIYYDSSLIPRASRRYIVSRPPLLVRVKCWFRNRLSKIWNA